MIYHLSSHTISLSKATADPSHSTQQFSTHYLAHPHYLTRALTQPTTLLLRRHSIDVEVPLQLPLQLRALQAWSLASRLDGILFLRVRAGEDDIQLFKTATFGFWEEEPDAGEDGGVEDAC